MDTRDSSRRARPLLGTFVEIAAAGATPPKRQQAIDEAFDAIAQVHRLMSFHDPQSDVSRLNREAFARAIPVHPWTYQVLETALKIHRHSAGQFDITIAPLLQKSGLLPRNAENCERAGERTTATNQIELRARHFVRYRKSGVKIDLGGIAKGFAVDRALDILQKHGLARSLVNAGGDLAVFGPQPERVNIRNPKNASHLFCEVAIINSALASSGQALNPFRTVETSDCAVFDPSTQKSVRDIAGATVCAPSCMIADALTKVVMIAGKGATGLLKQFRASALLVQESGDIWITPDWHDALRLAA